MEMEVRKRKAELYRYQGVGFGIYILASAYLFYMVLGIDSDYISWKFGEGIAVLVTASICIVYALFVAAAGLVIRLGACRILEILATECDPFLYEACIRRNNKLLFRDRLMCNIALAQHCQGNFDRAWETLQGIDVRKLKGIFRVNYYILLSAQYFKRGMGLKVRELEEGFLRSISGQTQYQQEYGQMNCRGRKRKEWRYFEMLCAGNNLIRALENQDYHAASRFLYDRMELNGNVEKPWTKVNYTLKAAKIYLGLGDRESAKLCLEYVVSKGNRMWCVQEAERILEALPEP